MLKLIPLLILVLIFFKCGDRKPTKPSDNKPSPAPTVAPVPTPEVTPTPLPSPIETPTPSPSVEPSPLPSPVAQATPWPTPQIDPSAFIPPAPAGNTVRVEQVGDEDYSAKVQAAQDDPTTATVVIGPGSFRRSVILRKHTKIDTTPEKPLRCDQVEPLPQFRGFPISDYGCMLLADGVHVEGNWRMPQALLDYFKFGNGRNKNDPYLLKVQALTDDQLHGNASTVLEPEFALGPANPGIEVFQALGDVLNSHTGKAHNIAVTGIVIVGRQRTYDGGVRSAVLFGNCEHCTAQDLFLRDAGSIGVLAGGSAREANNFSKGVLMWHNIASGVGAANFAAVNSEDVWMFENYVRRPGHHEPKFGGGVCGFDLETNSEADHSKNIFVFNNLFDFEDAARETIGTAICLQDPYLGANHGKVVAANNVAIGGREDIVHRYMTSGAFLNGLKSCEYINNYVFRTGQSAVQGYGLDGCLIQDQDFEHTGGGGSLTIDSYGVINTTVRRSDFRTRPGLQISAAAGFKEYDQSCGNTYEDNKVDGRPFTLTSPPCRMEAPRSGVRTNPTSPRLKLINRFR